MELKDLILQTLDEISSGQTKEAHIHTIPTQVTQPTHTYNDWNTPSDSQPISANQGYATTKSEESLREESEFLEMLQERLLVLFEGLSCEHNKNIQASLNITINFLEYQLSIIQERLNDIQK